MGVQALAKAASSWIECARTVPDGLCDVAQTWRRAVCRMTFSYQLHWRRTNEIRPRRGSCTRARPREAVRDPGEV